MVSYVNMLSVSGGGSWTTGGFGINENGWYYQPDYGGALIDPKGRTLEYMTYGIPASNQVPIRLKTQGGVPSQMVGTPKLKMQFTSTPGWSSSILGPYNDVARGVKWVLSIRDYASLGGGVISRGEAIMSAGVQNLTAESNSVASAPNAPPGGNPQYLEITPFAIWPNGIPSTVFFDPGRITINAVPDSFRIYYEPQPEYDISFPLALMKTSEVEMGETPGNPSIQNGWGIYAGWVAGFKASIGEGGVSSVEMGDLYLGENLQSLTPDEDSQVVMGEQTLYTDGSKSLRFKSPIDGLVQMGTGTKVLANRVDEVVTIDFVY